MALSALEQAYRDEYPRVLAALTRRLDGDLALAEDAVQDAFVAAAVAWERGGVPDRPAAWLTTTAWRSALDPRRHERVARTHVASLRTSDAVSYDLDAELERSSLDGDDVLAMLFTCCHPALGVEARLALTLRSVGGVPVPALARLFLVGEAAMERRLVRARRKVTDARIPFRVPPDELLAERLGGVLRVVYLLYTDAHASVAAERSAEALRLARLVARLMPDVAEVRGLLALLALTEARRPARLVDGALVALDEQDRSRWDAGLVAEGLDEVERALRLPRPGRYAIEAAIAAVHTRAPSFAATDWVQIAALYAEVLRIEPSPVAAVGRAIAVSYASGPAAGLLLLDELDLPGYQPLAAARADLLRRAGDTAGAAAALDVALAATPDARERAALLRRHGRGG